MRLSLAAVALATATATGLTAAAPAVAETPQQPAVVQAVPAAGMPVPQLDFDLSRIAVVPSLVATILASVVATLIINDPQFGSTGAKAGDSLSSNTFIDDTPA
ncbi:hypothetical protein ACFSSC_03935 [Corynebacterium mendelii]|uniref:Uncharacterized protein n=1 Tax=Corynebacterium mendelii TaxID=2765362 RepID=A0A939IWI2_9CORY|nr:hypothetical protein [Corynebacterium mendelii]MBN9643445.1 hypothetical protein [Corynebacterium mendelii]